MPVKVTEPLIKLCLAELTQQVAANQRYKDYYDGRHASLADEINEDFICQKNLWNVIFVENSAN
jgi:hypothetical protein